MCTLAATAGDRIGYRMLPEQRKDGVQLSGLVSVYQRVEEVVANDVEGFGIALFDSWG